MYCIICSHFWKNMPQFVFFRQRCRKDAAMWQIWHPQCARVPTTLARHKQLQKKQLKTTCEVDAEVLNSSRTVPNFAYPLTLKMQLSHCEDSGIILCIPHPFTTGIFKFTFWFHIFAQKFRFFRSMLWYLFCTRFLLILRAISDFWVKKQVSKNNQTRLVSRFSRYTIFVLREFPDKHLIFE